MKLIIKDNYDAMSQWAAEHIATAINNHKENRPFILGYQQALPLSAFTKNLSK